jgi:hypothetical protein
MLMHHCFNSSILCIILRVSVDLVICVSKHGSEAELAGVCLPCTPKVLWVEFHVDYSHVPICHPAISSHPGSHMTCHSRCTMQETQALLQRLHQPTAALLAAEYDTISKVQGFLLTVLPSSPTVTTLPLPEKQYAALMQQWCSIAGPLLSVLADRGALKQHPMAAFSASRLLGMLASCLEAWTGPAADKAAERAVQLQIAQHTAGDWRRRWCWLGQLRGVRVYVLKAFRVYLGGLGHGCTLVCGLRVGCMPVDSSREGGSEIYCTVESSRKTERSEGFRGIETVQ